ncbi:MAG: glycerophosphotransferase [Actinobacteria bacterium]|nr:glycerophosphotransferase [Actinomycetota bacterium]
MIRPSRPALVLVSTIAALYLALFVTALQGSALLFLLAVVASQAADEFVNRRSTGGRLLLRRVLFGQSNRALLREVLLLLLIARTSGIDTVWLVAVGLGVTTLAVTRGVLVGLTPLLRAVSRLPVEARNVPLSTPEITQVALDLAGDVPPDDADEAPAGPAPARPGLAGWRSDTASALFSASGVAVVGGALATVLGEPRVLLVLSLLVGAATGARAVHVARSLRRRSDRALRDRYLELVNEQVRALRPEVVLYFSGTKESAYQANMWLPVLERMPRRTLVLLRERVHMTTLGPTTVPVVCLPDPVDVMNFPMPTARVALYVANVGKNLHLLREPRLKHVFIGHGDSDKIASVNPFSKVHDEIWVAGRAARERYQLARVGVRDDSVVEVGRPQLDGIGTAGDQVVPADRPLTVLYAPTWEGWTNDTAQTSLAVQGVRLVKDLLALGPAVRVVFKPHPLTGTVTKEAAAALRSVERLLAAAGAAESGATPQPEPTTDPARAAEREQAWSEDFWSALPPTQHLVVRSPSPTLIDCFNHADLLVGDISSVVSDFVASEKPYVVTNPDGLPEDEFRASNPSTAGGYLLTPGGRGIRDVLDDVRGADPMRDARRAAREHLLGPVSPPSLDRWNAAVEALLARAGSEWGPVPEGPAEPGPVGHGPVDDDLVEEGPAEGRTPPVPGADDVPVPPRTEDVRLPS